MGERRPWGPLIPTTEGTYVQLYEDGSATTYDQFMNVVKDDASPNPLRAALARSGREREAAEDTFRSAASAEDARRFGLGNANAIRGLDIQADQIEQNHKVALAQARTSADVARANAEYQQAQAQNLRDRLAFDRESFGQNLEFEKQKQAENLGLSRAKLGYDLIGTAAQLRGPANFYQAAEYNRGVAAQPETSTFLSALQDNTRLRGYGAQGGLPERETVGTLTAKLGGGTGLQSGAPSEDATLSQIGNIATKGAHQLGNNSLEQLTPTEYDLFTSGLDRLGIDKAGFLDQYRRSRIGQSAGGAGYRAA